MLPVNDSFFTTSEISEWVRDARQRTFDLIADLTDEDLRVPYLPILNPFLWEIGHVAWFQERWILRHVGKKKTSFENADEFFDSSGVPHTTRWELNLPSRDRLLEYLSDVRDRVLERLQKNPSSDEIYFILLSLFHEDMHTEAFTYTRQTMEYPAPKFSMATSSASIDNSDCSSDPAGTSLNGDVEIPGGKFFVGAKKDAPFVFDNEKWSHQVEVQPFAMSRTAVSQAEFAEFVDAGGYESEKFWSSDGWQWCQSTEATRPLYWRREATGGGWLRRHFDQWIPLEAHLPVLHVNWYEAESYCNWAKRRLPTEVEWEVAASGEPSSVGQEPLAEARRRYPWGDARPSSEVANLDWRNMGPVDVRGLPSGESAFGCRQMIGNVWEWTGNDFLPYAGFEADPYKDYSEPWFQTHKVLKGGCWTTRSRLINNVYRNFYKPDRRDVLAGFRTCAIG